MYDDTVHQAGTGIAELALPYYRSPRIEPEIVFELKEPLASGGLDAATVLRSVDWLAIGFEVIDCPYREWQFKPADFVAAFGLHRALVVGQRLQVEPEMVPALVSGLGSFKVRVSKDGQFIEKGFGRNALRSPALGLAELAGAVLGQPGHTFIGWRTRQHRHAHEWSSDHLRGNLAGRRRWPAASQPDISRPVISPSKCVRMFLWLLLPR
jgi:2-keto-4-pentenoate hydratase